MPNSYRELSEKEHVAGLPSDFQFAVVRPNSKGDFMKIGFSRLALVGLILACCFNPRELVSSWYVLFMAVVGFFVLLDSSCFTTTVWGFDKGRFGFSSWPYWFKTIDAIDDVKMQYSLKKDCRTLLVKSAIPVEIYYMSLKFSEVSEIVVTHNIPLAEFDYLTDQIRLACFEKEPDAPSDSSSKE